MGTMAYPERKVSTAEARAICLRSIAVRIALRMDGIWPVLFTPVARGSHQLAAR